MIKKRLLVHGQSVSYLEMGNEQDPTVVLLHGVPESSLLWKEIMPAIVSCGFRTIAPDLPGFGHSNPFPEASTWERYEQFFTEFLAEMGLENFHLVVHDWGGIIGLKWACDHPYRIQSLVISDTTISADYSWHSIAQVWRTPKEGEKLVERMSDWDRWSAGMKQEVPNISDEVLEDFFRVLQTPDTRQAILDLYRSGDMCKLEPYRGKLRMIKTPVTILWGENDPYIPANYAFQLREEELPQANVHIIPDAGHFIHVQAADEVKRFVTDHFLPLK